MTDKLPFSRCPWCMDHELLRIKDGKPYCLNCDFGRVTGYAEQLEGPVTLDVVAANPTLDEVDGMALIMWADDNDVWAIANVEIRDNVIVVSRKRDES